MWSKTTQLSAGYGWRAKGWAKVLYPERIVSPPSTDAASEQDHPRQTLFLMGGTRTQQISFSSHAPSLLEREPRKKACEANQAQIADPPQSQKSWLGEKIRGGSAALRTQAGMVRLQKKRRPSVSNRQVASGRKPKRDRRTKGSIDRRQRWLTSEPQIDVWSQVNCSQEFDPGNGVAGLGEKPSGRGMGQPR